MVDGIERPKMHMAQEGNHRELRYFQPWNPHQVEQYRLPAMFHKLQGCETCPIGDSIVSTKETRLGFETCEEMWTPIAPQVCPLSPSTIVHVAD